jgi:transcriptional regulator with XRE-family HTH domain
MMPIPDDVIAATTMLTPMAVRAGVTTSFGRQLKLWRSWARMSQLELSVRAGLSQRHLSFLETGRSRPGTDVVLRIAAALEIPLRDRNRLLESAGLAAHYPEVELSAGVSTPFRAAVVRLLEAHEPFPAFVLNRWWDVVDANVAARRLFPSSAGLTQNAVEAFLAPGGMRGMIENFPEVAGMYLRRLQAEVAEASDERSLRLLARAKELLADVDLTTDTGDGLVICPRLRIGDEVVSTATMVARFGATREVTLDELRVELIFPADEAARAFFERQREDAPRATPERSSQALGVIPTDVVDRVRAL